MPTLDSTEVFVGQTGHIYVAPVGTAFPTSISDPVDVADWDELGYVDVDGVQFTESPNLQKFNSWQKRKPVRMTKGDVEATIGFNMQQWNATSVVLAQGGGEVTEDAPGEYHVSPPDEFALDERALIVESSDGDNTMRKCYTRVLNQAPFQFKWARSEESKLPIEFMVLSADGDEEDSFIQTDMPSFATGS